jgi:hypothetical protein
VGGAYSDCPIVARCNTDCEALMGETESLDFRYERAGAART